MNLNHALAQGLQSGRTDSVRPQAGVLVAGAIGRIGEALLNRVLADEAGRGGVGGRPVIALAASPMAMGMRGLTLASMEALPPLDAAFLILNDSADAEARSFYGRDAPFVQVDELNCVHVARRAVESGARRLVLIAPMAAWRQIGKFHTGLADSVELELARLPLDSLVVLRPVRNSGRRGASLVERFVSVYLSVQLLMLPRTLEAITSEKLARCAAAAMRNARPGVTVFPADAIPGLLETPAAPVQCAP
ncbi:hypothetical protein [Quisquiliibacterium transsilvanicum]|uniref:Uncharacterized protein n=1 Tax=Quisquiliibacterium transsilvanicum TaxID=1549638 RepID=A0A7W8HIE9_9BURK|nr:hypothetical protein [Quisquiliibacterium transsilvanicum]MBB5272634.1 hypothetical protein [Quisquiliibacterium transsilvanicum]